jgi:hypothetical protein
VPAEGAPESIPLGEIGRGPAIGTGDGEIDLVLEDSGGRERRLHGAAGFGRAAEGERFGEAIENLADASEPGDRRRAAIAGMVCAFEHKVRGRLGRDVAGVRGIEGASGAIGSEALASQMR